MRLFLSHASADGHIARCLEAHLRDVGVEVIMLPDAAPPGSSWMEHIRAFARECDELLTLATPHSVLRHWIAAEWACFWIQGKPCTPVLVGSAVTDLWDPMRAAQAVDLLQVSQSASFFRRLAAVTGVQPPEGVTPLARRVVDEITSVITRQAAEKPEPSGPVRDASAGSRRDAEPAPELPDTQRTDAGHGERQPRKARQAPWLKRIDASRSLNVAGMTALGAPPGSTRKSTRRPAWFPGSILVWLLVAGSLAWEQSPRGWFIAAATIGMLCLLCLALAIGFAGDGFEDGSSIASSIALLLGFAALVLSIVGAVVGVRSWPTGIWVAGAVAAFAAVLIAGTGRAEDAGNAARAWAEADRTRQKRERQVQMTEIVRRERWLNETDYDQPGVSLLDDLAEIPAVRFCSLSDDPFRFLAIAGTRVALVAIASWPPGTYTRRNGAQNDVCLNGRFCSQAASDVAKIAVAAQQWRSLPLGGVDVLFVVVVRPVTASRGDHIMLTTKADGTELDEDDIRFTTQDTFADVAGPFLADCAYTLNISVLEQLVRQPPPGLKLSGALARMASSREDAVVQAVWRSLPRQ